MHSGEPPKVSICIPTYNYAHYITDAIESVISQTLRDFELIIIDDCSTDNTVEIVKKYLTLDARIKLYNNIKNIGLENNFNRCIELASGKYVKVMCADDLLEPTCIGKSVKLLEEHPSASLLSCSRQVVTSDLLPIRILSFSVKSEFLSGHSVIRKCLFHGNLIGEPTATLFKKENATRGFRTEYKQLLDLEMWLHLLEKGDFLFIPEALCKFRRHEGQRTRFNTKNYSFVNDEINIFSEYIDKKYIDMPVYFKSILKLFREITVRTTKTKLQFLFALSDIKSKLTDYFKP
jgi:glycosyltransferase involved in cell wall biosynthesis